MMKFALALMPVVLLALSNVEANINAPRPAVHHSAPKPVVHHSAPKPAHHSVPKPVVHHNAPKPIHHSAPKPVVHHNVPKPVPKPKPIHHTAPKPPMPHTHKQPVPSKPKKTPVHPVPKPKPKTPTLHPAHKPKTPTHPAHKPKTPTHQDTKHKTPTHSVTKPKVPVPQPRPNPKTVPQPSPKHEAIANVAKSVIGTPYSWGGGTLKGKSYGVGRGAKTFGFDCSGLARYAVYQATGKTIARTAGAQFADKQCAHVPFEQRRAGDLVFFNDGGRIHHVAIVSGTGSTMVHAPQTGDHVKESLIRMKGHMSMVARC